MTRSDIVEIALSLADVGAAPDTRAAYLDLIAPVESGRLREDMAGMYGCGLVVRGIWRRAGIVHPVLSAPYRIQHAISDVEQIARDAGALSQGWERVPEPGDVVCVGGSSADGGPLHVWTVATITEAGAGYLCDGIDGGQLDDARRQIVRAREHAITVRGDGSAWDSALDAPGRMARRVRWVVDAGAVLAALG